jgi:transposase InsO family protein
MLTDRGTEFCGTQSHEYELYLAVEDIDHSRTKTKSPQTNGICERFHRTVLDEFYRVALDSGAALRIISLRACRFPPESKRRSVRLVTCF